jgi:N6-L-threonylcarbamoyladenine synthase
MVGQPNCDFSFSGLKTAAKRAIDALPAGEVSREDANDLCYVFQQTVSDILIDRTKNAIEKYLLLNPQSLTLVVAGGVAANKLLRGNLEALAAKYGLSFKAPPLKLCTDNAAMIAWAGMERLRLGMTDPADFPVYPRWPLDPDAPVASVKSQKR